MLKPQISALRKSCTMSSDGSFSETVLAVAAGMSSPKKGNFGYQKMQRYLNYGLLGLISNFEQKIYMLHGNFMHPKEFCDKYQEFIIGKKIIMLSIPSYYSVSWAESFIQIVKGIDEHIQIFVGGRWVLIDPAVRKKFSGCRIFGGLGEVYLKQFESALGLKIGEHASGVSAPCRLNYDLLVQAEEFNPVVEFSRGCGMGCVFCQESDKPLSKPKSPIELSFEISRIKKSSPKHNNFYFESSFFAPSLNYCQDFAQYYQTNELNIQWRATTRVDTLSPEKIKLLAKSGLTVLDLGLESASGIQLIKMGKSDNPNLYLKKASELLAACYENGIAVKVNILLYAGETDATIAETVNWLEKHAHAIKGISAYPVLVFGDDANFVNSLTDAGAEAVFPSKTFGVSNVDLSPSISFHDAAKLAVQISQMFQSKEDYFYLKGFSYFPPDFSYQQFLSLIAENDSKYLPFGV